MTTPDEQAREDIGGAVHDLLALVCEIISFEPVLSHRTRLYLKPIQDWSSFIIDPHPFSR